MDNIKIIKKYALNYLSKYDTSKNNLKKILQKKVRRINLEEKEKLNLYKAISSIILELEFKKIINDNNYSNRKIHNFALQGKSKIFIKNYLTKKGIEKNLINETLNNFEIENPDWEIESAITFIRKKRLDSRDNKNKEKNMAKMARAGFGYDIIKKTLRIDY